MKRISSSSTPIKLCKRKRKDSSLLHLDATVNNAKRVSDDNYVVNNPYIICNDPQPYFIGGGLNKRKRCALCKQKTSVYCNGCGRYFCMKSYYNTAKKMNSKTDMVKLNFMGDSSNIMNL